MKKYYITALLLAAFLKASAQQNSLLTNDFWKQNPTLEQVYKEINAGNSPSISNAASFDPVTMAINNRVNNDIIIAMIEMPGNGVTKKTHHSRTYLHWAAATGNLELVKYLLDNGSAPNAKDSKGASIISYAAANGNSNLEIYDLLIKAGVNPKETYENNASLLMMAAPYDSELKITDFFISKGLKITDKDEHGRSVADYAARLGNIQIIKKLEDRGIKLTNNALQFATQGSRQVSNKLDFFKFLVEEKKLDPATVFYDGTNIFHHIVRKGDLEIINYFLEKKVAIDKPDHEGNTPFMKVASGTNTNLAGLLLKNGAKINAPNSKKQTPILLALEAGSSEMVQFLLDNKALLSVKDKDGNNAAFYLFNSINENVIAQVEKQKNDRKAAPRKAQGENPKDDTKANPLMEFHKKTRILTAANFNFAEAQGDGSSLYHLAVAKNIKQLLSIADKLGAQINATDKEGMTALHKAALVAKDTQIMDKLLELGADKKIKNELEETAYDLAKENSFLKNKNISVEYLK